MYRQDYIIQSGMSFLTLFNQVCLKMYALVAVVRQIRRFLILTLTLVLVNLFSKNIFVQLIKQARESVPREVLNDFVECCVEHGRYQQLTALVETWPESTFRIAPRRVSDHYDFIREQKAIANIEIASERNEKLKNRFKVLISVLQKVLRQYKENRANITTLDITHHPLSLELFMFLQKEWLAEPTPRKLTLITDLVITENCLVEDFLEKSSFNIHQNIVIKPRNIYFEFVQRTRNYSELFYSEFLYRMSISSNFSLDSLEGVQLSTMNLRESFAGQGAKAALFFDGLKEIVPATNLTKLDLNYNGINLNGDENATTILGSFLSHFSNLRRLSLNGNRLTNKLGAILKTSTKLEYLNVGGCQLRQIDVSFLATLTSLSHLDISSTQLANKLNVLKTVLMSLGQLTILEMEDCGLNDECIRYLRPQLRSMKSLKALNLYFNKIYYLELDCAVLLNGRTLYDDDDFVDWSIDPPDE